MLIKCARSYGQTQTSLFLYFGLCGPVEFTNTHAVCLCGAPRRPVVRLAPANTICNPRYMKHCRPPTSLIHHFGFSTLSKTTFSRLTFEPTHFNVLIQAKRSLVKMCLRVCFNFQIQSVRFVPNVRKPHQILLCLYGQDNTWLRLLKDTRAKL